MSNLRAWLAEKSSEETEHFLGEVPRLWLESGQIKKFCRLLTDFDFIEAKINYPQFGVLALIEDYDLIDDAELLTHPEYNAQTVKALKLIQGALRLSAHIIEQDKTQLKLQLWGRLQSFEMSDVQSMLESLNQSKTTWLRPLTDSLYRPNGRLLRTFIGHRGNVTSVALTPDGKQVISGSSDETLKVWDLKTGQTLFTLKGHTEGVTAVAITPDGKRIISASSDKTMKVWDLQTQKEIFTLNGHKNSVNAIAITSDSKRLISGSSDGTLKEWNLITGEELFTLIDSSSLDGCKLIQAVTITRDDKWVIFCAYVSHQTFHHDSGGTSFSWEIIIYNLETRNQKRLSSTVQKSGHAFVVTQDDKWVIFDSKKAVKIFNLETYRQKAFRQKIFKILRQKTTDKNLFTLKGHNNLINAVALTPDDQRVISGSSDKTLKVWDREKCEELFTFEGHASSVNAVAVTSDGKWAISGSSDKTLKVWNLITEEKKITLNSDNQLLKVGGVTKNECDGGNISDCETREKILPPINHIDSINAIAVTPDGKCVVSASLDKKIIVSNLETSQVLFTHKEKFFSFHSIVITPDSKYLIYNPWEAILNIRDLQTGKLLLSLPSWFNVITGITLFFITIVFIYWQLILISWKIYYFLVRLMPTLVASIIVVIVLVLFLFLFLNLLNIFSNIDNFIEKDFSSIGITPDGKRVISCFYKTINVWNIKTRKKVFTLKGHTDSVTSLAITSDGKYLISGSIDKTLKVWNLNTGRQLFTLRGHSDWITSIAVTADGKQVISASKDKTLKVWNLEKRSELFTLTGNNNSVDTVAVTLDGKRVISGSWGDNIIKVWDLESKEVIASFNGDSQLRCCAVAPDGVTIVAGEASGRLHFLRLEGIEA